MTQIITSLHNPTVKNLVKLRQRRARDRQRLMLIDGARALRLALHNAFPVTAIYFAEDVAHQEVSAAVFHKIGYGDNPDGVLGVASQPGAELTVLPARGLPLYVVTEGLEKP